MFRVFHGSSWKRPRLPWKFVEYSTISMEACEGLWKLPRLWKLEYASCEALVSIHTTSRACLLASHMIDCESCTWSISTNSASIESSELGLTNGHDFVEAVWTCPRCAHTHAGVVSVMMFYCEHDRLSKNDFLVYRASLEACDRCKATKRMKTPFYR